MPVRHARTQWTGDLQTGTGVVELTSSGLGSFEVSFPRRAADDANGVTSPEELVAAAHTSCFSMQFSALLGEAGAADIALDVSAAVALGPDPDGGFMLTEIALTVRGSATGVDSDQFVAIAEQAKATCPISKALAGVRITIDAALQ